MGWIVDILRLALAVVIALFMMPSKKKFTFKYIQGIRLENFKKNKGISYSAIGRYFEWIDLGHNTYTGFLHMEASKNLVENKLKY